MKKEDLDALSGLYEGLYSPAESGEYLSEEYLEEYTRQADRPGQTPAEARAAQQASKARGASAAQAYQSKANAYKPPGISGVLSQLGRFASGPSPQGRMNSELGRASKPAPKSTAKPDVKPAPKPTLTDAEFDKKYGTNDPNNNLARPETGKTRINPPKPGAGAPASAKVAPTAAAKPAGQTGDKAKDMATWAKANPTLANKPKTPNPLMQKTFGYQTGNAPDQIKAASAGGDPAKAAASFARSKETAKKLGASGTMKAISSSYEWPSAKTIRDIAGAYASIYEAKKKDQDQDGDNDFADVRIARMIASGMSKAEAIAAVKNKEYNEEYELDEATRMRKELGKEGETATRKELAARSRAYKRSGSVDKTIAAAERGADRPYIKHKRDESDADRSKREEKQSRTLRRLAASRRGSVRDKPRAGMRGYAAKVEGSDKDLQTARQRAMSAGTLTPKEKKQMGEEYTVYEIVASYLLENNFAETLNDANVIIENMSETWVAHILESFE